MKTYWVVIKENAETTLRSGHGSIEGAKEFADQILQNPNGAATEAIIVLEIARRKRIVTKILGEWDT